MRRQGSIVVALGVGLLLSLSMTETAEWSIPSCPVVNPTNASSFAGLRSW